jgi:hypothetical protein
MFATKPLGGEDWGVVKALLPEGWREQAKATGALQRNRNFSGAEALLRVLLIHLVDGCSLRETSVRARQGGLAQASDVALLKRLKACGEWFRWMAGALMRQYLRPPPESLLPGLRIRWMDGSSICEPGATGSTWRLHYAVSLPTLHCDEVYVTDPAVGESFKRFRVTPGDVFVGDRGYAHRAGIRHVVQEGGHVLVRLNLDNVPLEREDGARFDLLAHLRTLESTATGDWPVWIRDEEGRIPARVCAIRKSAQAAERAREKLHREAARKKRQVKPPTLEAAGYIFILTTLPVSITAVSVLEVYRGRWQIELAFKRLKSILGVGHLKKTDPEGAKAWLQGKLMIAFLIESMIAAGERFFPWGYPLTRTATPLSLAGNVVDAPLAEHEPQPAPLLGELSRQREGDCLGAAGTDPETAKANGQTGQQDK